MSSYKILALVFLVLSLGLLFYICKSNPEDKNLKCFYIASTGVYVSGTVLIFVLCLFVNAMDLPVVIAMEIVILFVYVFDTFILKKIAGNLADLRDAAVKAKEKEDNEKKT